MRQLVDNLLADAVRAWCGGRMSHFGSGLWCMCFAMCLGMLGVWRHSSLRGSCNADRSVQSLKAEVCSKFPAMQESTPPPPYTLVAHILAIRDDRGECAPRGLIPHCCPVSLLCYNLQGLMRPQGLFDTLLGSSPHPFPFKRRPTASSTPACTLSSHVHPRPGQRLSRDQMIAELTILWTAGVSTAQLLCGWSGRLID